MKRILCIAAAVLFVPVMALAQVWTGDHAVIYPGAVPFVLPDSMEACKLRLTCIDTPLIVISTSPYGMGHAIHATGDTIAVHGISGGANAAAIVGEATDNSGTNYGGYFSTASASGYGVYGVYSGDSDRFGILAGDKSSTIQGYGAYGQYTSAIYGALGCYVNGQRAGVGGTSNDADGYGVFGQATADSGFGGYFQQTDTDDARWTYGVYGSSANATKGYGGYFTAPGTYGVYGSATGASGTNYGVYGVTASSSGYGVYGVGPGNAYGWIAGGNYGAFGTGSNSAFVGYLGYAGSAGVYGRSTTSGSGVWGQATHATSNLAWGIRGSTSSTAGTGVGGEATQNTAWAVYGDVPAGGIGGGFGSDAQCFQEVGITAATDENLGANYWYAGNTGTGNHDVVFLINIPEVLHGAQCVVDSFKLVYSTQANADTLLTVDVYAMQDCVASGSWNLTDVGAGLNGCQTQLIGTNWTPNRHFAITMRYDPDETMDNDDVHIYALQFWYTYSAVATAIP